MNRHQQMGEVEKTCFSIKSAGAPSSSKSSEHSYPLTFWLVLLAGGAHGSGHLKHHVLAGELQVQQGQHTR